MTPPCEPIDAGAHQVVSVVTRRGRASGIEVQTTVALLSTLRDGKVVQNMWFPTREQALPEAESRDR
jgi:ketosteroid isomerase-like protein